jgi:hypothetical protein
MGLHGPTPPRTVRDGGDVIADRLRKEGDDKRDRDPDVCVPVQPRRARALSALFSLPGVRRPLSDPRRRYSTTASSGPARGVSGSSTWRLMASSRCATTTSSRGARWKPACGNGARFSPGISDAK